MQRLVVTIALVVMTSLGLSSSGTAAQSDESLSLTVAASNCPDLIDYNPDADANVSTCEAGEGITLTAFTQTLGDFGSCVTSGSVETPDAGSYASCQIPVPDGLTDDSELVVQLFYEGVPDGYDASFDTISITVGDLRSDPDTALRFYNPATPPPGPTEPPGYPITTFVCDTDPGPWSPFSARDIGGGCVRTGGISVTASLEDGTVLETCTTSDRGTCYLIEIPGGVDLTLVFTEDESTLPEGYIARDNPQTGVNATEFKGTYFVNLPADAPVNAPPEQETTATATTTAETAGSTAAIYLGDCDHDTFSDPVAQLTPVVTPDGDTAGATDVGDVETSFSTILLSMDDLLGEDHAIVVFDQDDATVPLACGVIGGVVSEDGSLAFGLPLVGDSRYSGVAFLTPDDDATNVSLFLAEDLSADETPTA